MGAELDRGEISVIELRGYYALFHLFVFTMAMTALANNLAVFWIAIEATTLVSALLVGFYRNRQSIEAAWKYIILCTVSISFALLGIFLIFHASVKATGGAGTLEWSELKRIAGSLDPATMHIAFIFIIVGYGAKAGLAPLHNWLPDAHSQAPTPISALLSSVLLKCAMLGVLRVLSLGAGTQWGGEAGTVLMVFGLISMGIATAFILMQNNYKRLLAYSSIEHLGIIAVGAGGGVFLGLFGALLHFINHAVVKTLLFFVTGELRLHYHSTKAENITGALKTMPVTGTVMLLAAFAIAGAPPFNVFISEFVILKSSAQQGHWVTFALFLIFVTIIFGGVLRHFGSMAFGRSEGRAVQGWLAPGLFIVLASVMLVMGVHIPAPIESLVSAAADIVTGGGR
jgi:hydrogenase-4 component F